MVIEYSIVSIGTERHGSLGYMGISKAQSNGVRIVSPTPHIKKDIDVTPNCLFCHSLSIDLITLMRFQLIPAVCIPESITSYRNIEVVGAGSVGVATCFELKRRNINNFKLITSRKSIKQLYHPLTNFEINNELDPSADYIIDCTGDIRRIKEIIEYTARPMTLQLIGTPREDLNVSVLFLHRENITIAGGHELNNRNPALRRRKWSELEHHYLNNPINIAPFIAKHTYSQERLYDILNHKYIQPFHVLCHKE